MQPDPVRTLLSSAEVMEIFQISRTTLWEMEKRGEIPKAITFGRKCKRWRRSDIDEFIERKAG